MIKQTFVTNCCKPSFHKVQKEREEKEKKEEKEKQKKENHCTGCTYSGLNQFNSEWDHCSGCFCRGYTMRLKPRQNHEENERQAYAGERGSAKWGSRWPRLGVELRLARQTDCSKAKVYEWLLLLEDGAVGLNCGKYQDNFRIFWNWAWNRPQNPSVSFLLLSNTYAA